MGGKNCPKSEETKPSPLPRSMDATPSERTRRVRHNPEQDLGCLEGMMRHIHLSDPVQAKYFVISHRGPRRRHRDLYHKNLNHEHSHSDELQEEGGIDIHHITRTIKLARHRRRGLRFRHYRLSGVRARAEPRHVLHEILSDTSEHGAIQRRRAARHLRHIHHHHHEHRKAVAAVHATLRAALKEELDQSCGKKHSHRGSAHKGNHHHHHGKDASSTNDNASEGNQNIEDTSSEQSGNHPRLNGRHLNALRRPYTCHHHCQSGDPYAHFSQFPGGRSNRHHFTIPMPLATPGPFSDWPTYDYETFVRSNHYHGPRGLPNHVHEGAILFGGQMLAMHGRHRRSMHKHHH